MNLDVNASIGRGKTNHFNVEVKIMRLKIFSLLSCSVLISQCGSEPQTPKKAEVKNERTQSEDVEADPGRAVSVPAEYYDVVMHEEFKLLSKSQRSDSMVETIVLNFEGAFVNKGFDKRESFLLCKDEVSIPSAGLSPEEIDSILGAISQKVRDYDSTLKVVGAVPRTANYSVIHVGGTFADLGCVDDENVKYLAPSDRENVNSNDTAFVFYDDLDSTEDLKKQIMRVISHINPSQNRYGVSSGSESLAGLAEVQSIAKLLAELDPNNILDISPLKQQLLAISIGGVEYLGGFDRVLSVVLGVSEHNAQQDQQQSPYGDMFAWVTNLLGIAANNTELVAGVATLVGHPEIAAAVTMVGPILSGIAAGASSLQQQSESSQEDSLVLAELPNFAAVLGATNSDSLQELIDELRAYASYISANYDSETLEALNSLLVVAYSQAYHDYMDSQLGLTRAED